MQNGNCPTGTMVPSGEWGDGLSPGCVVGRRLKSREVEAQQPRIPWLSLWRRELLIRTLCTVLYSSIDCWNAKKTLRSSCNDIAIVPPWTSFKDRDENLPKFLGGNQAMPRRPLLRSLPVNRNDKSLVPVLILCYSWCSKILSILPWTVPISFLSFSLSCGDLQGLSM